MNGARKQTIMRRVQTLLQENQVKTQPVPVERIVNSLGAQLRFSPLDDALSGMIYVKEGTPIIGVNALHHPNRQRFTIAHECGHLVLHRAQISQEVHVDKEFPMLMRDAVSAAGVNAIEIEANLFAAELLMPVFLLAKALGNEPLDIDDEGAVSALARSFRVSPSAIRFRLGDLFA